MAVRQAGLSCDRFDAMHAVTFATSGMNSEQSRIASGVQACRASASPCAPAPWSPHSRAPTGNVSRKTKRTISISDFPAYRMHSLPKLRVAIRGSAVDILEEEHLAARSRTARSASAPFKIRWESASPPGNIARAPLYTAAAYLPGHIVDRHVTAKYTIGHRIDEIANTPRLARRNCRLKKRINCGVADDQQRRTDKGEEQRRNDGDARGPDALLVQPDERCTGDTRGRRYGIPLCEP